ncbi:MAG: hypothetical protein PVJ71_00035 [Lysobacterales bacterium]|jgi:hypothetical protein
MRLSTSLLFLPLLTLAGCASLTVEERDIDLSQVPPDVLEAARQAVPGFEPTEAEIEYVYELDGEANGKAYEIEVSPDGEVKEVEVKDG